MEIVIMREPSYAGYSMGAEVDTDRGGRFDALNQTQNH
jgi:hypothetical protein